MVDESIVASSDTDSADSMLRKVAHLSSPQLKPQRVGQLPLGRSLAGGRFQVLLQIGQGGMGVVYEAFDKERGGRVALKTLSRLDAAGIYRLKNEFRALADVPHANLVRLHELFAEDEIWFFTMDLIAGVPFDRWVRPEGQLDEARLRASLPQLVSAVLAIHDAGKLHRDLKPSNALVQADGQVVVLDFGLAMDPTQGGVGHTIDDACISGTPGYMAPEQAAFAELGPACDWYALGVMLFEALTGRLPFDGDVSSIIQAKQTLRAPVARELSAAIPEDLSDLCCALLVRDPAQRAGREAVCARLGVPPESASRMRSSAPSGVPPSIELLGREHELATLHSAWLAAQTGDKPVVVFVTGESGIGKSALVKHFLSELGASGRTMLLAGRCYERESVPYKAFDGLMDELSRELRRKSGEYVASLMPREVWALRRLFPVLGRVGVLADAPELNAPDVHELRQRGFKALGELLARIRDRQPLVLSVDDLQWADEDSMALLLHLLRQADAPRVLLLLSHRSGPEQRLPILRPLYDALPSDVRLDVRTLAVGPLSTEACRAITRAHTHRQLDDLASEAAGNPFLLRELLRSVAAASQPRVVGASLSQLLSERVEALPAEQRELLEVLAVAARPLAVDVAGESARLDATRPVLEALRSVQLVCTSGQPGSIECYHDKIREVVFAGLPEARVRALHRRLADVLERRADADLEHLCAHCEAAGLHERAALHARSAALRAADALAFERAAHFYDKALASAHWTASERRRLCIARADVLAHAGRGAVAAAAYLDAADGAGVEEALELKRRAAEQYVYSGNLTRGHALLEEALHPLDIRLPRTTAGAITSLFYQRGRLRLRGHALREGRSVDPLIARKLAALRGAGSALIRTDGLRGTDLLLRHVLLALDSGDALEACRGLAWTIVGCKFAGLSYERLDAIASRCEALCDRTGDAQSLAMLHFGRGWARFGEPAALAEFERSIALFREQPFSDAYYNRTQAEMLCAIQRAFHGDLQRVARELPAHIDEAWSRGDLCIVPMWCGVASIARLAGAEVAGVTRDLDRARAAWPAEAFTFQDFSLLQGRTMLARYLGDATSAWDAVQSSWPRFQRSLLVHMPYFAHWVYAHRGEAALLRAAAARVASERAELIETAARMCARLPAKGRTGLPLRAALAFRRGDTQTAVATLRAGVRTMPSLWANAARRRLGVLVGGDEGAQLVREADDFLLARGVAAPQQLVAALFPALDPH